MRILCTGNPIDRIANSLQKIYPNITFISRTNGYDLTTVEGIDKFKQLLPEYDVFINHSQIEGNVQCKLLECTKEVWDTGHVINVGSVIEFKQWEWIDPIAAEEKRQLRDLSLNLSSEHFKTTHLILGAVQFKLDDALRLPTDRIANTIKWILENENHIPLMYVDHVSDELISSYLK